MAEPLHAISILQPWAWAIVEGHKLVENRTWCPPFRVRGKRIAIHASAGYDLSGLDFMRELGGFEQHMGLIAKGPVARGAIVGTARVLGAIRCERDSRGAYVLQRAGQLPNATVDAALRSVWTFGPWAWLLAEPRKLREPVSMKGALGVWTVPADLALRIPALEVTP